LSSTSQYTFFVAIKQKTQYHSVKARRLDVATGLMASYPVDEELRQMRIDLEI